MQILIVGAGYMGRALGQAWSQPQSGDPMGDPTSVHSGDNAGDDTTQTHHLTMIDPFYDNISATPNAISPNAATPNVSTIDFFKNLADVPPNYRPDMIVLAVKPQIMADVLPAYMVAFGNVDCLWVSIAAGLTVSFFESFGAGLPLPLTVIRCMPNMPLVYNAGAIGLFSKQQNAVRPIIDPLFKKVGQVVWLSDEVQMNAVTAISGSGPAYIYLMIEALTKAGVKQGLLESQAAILARQTVIGVGEVLKNAPDVDCQTLRRQVTSAKGTTEAALDVLLDGDAFSQLIDQAVDAPYQRAIVLGQV